MKIMYSFPQFITFSLQFLCLNVEKDAVFVLVWVWVRGHLGAGPDASDSGTIPVPLQGKQGPVGISS